MRLSVRAWDCVVMRAHDPNTGKYVSGAFGLAKSNKRLCSVMCGRAHSKQIPACQVLSKLKILFDKCVACPCQQYQASLPLLPIRTRAARACAFYHIRGGVSTRACTVRLLNISMRSFNYHRHHYWPFTVTMSITSAIHCATNFRDYTL